MNFEVISSNPRRQATALQPAWLVKLVDSIFENNPGPPISAEAYDILRYSFKVRVLALQSDTPRDPRFTPWINCPTQCAFIGQILAGTSPGIAHLPHVLFFLPERWMNPVELTKFMLCLEAYSKANPGLLEQVDLITQSPVILTDFVYSDVRVLTTPLPVG